MTLYLIIVILFFAISAGVNAINYKDGGDSTPLSANDCLVRAVIRLGLAMAGVAVLASSV